MAIEMTDEFIAALDALQGGDSVFITGKAGTGKSTLIRHFMNNTERNVVVAAPTGVAALNVNGYTIHRLFSFSPTTTVDDVRAGRAKPGRFSRVIGRVETLIIDEASMLRADMFDMIVASLERYGPCPGETFGGVQIVLVGDLYQLPPVVTDSEKEYFQTVYQGPYFFNADAYDDGYFRVFQLSKVFRQLGDQVFTQTLNAIRDGRIDGETLKTLNARVDNDFIAPSDEMWLTLATTNRKVTSVNKRHLEALPGQSFISCAQEVGQVEAKDLTAEKNLEFKVGAQVMMLTNDPAGRWVNGSMGTVVDVSPQGEDEYSGIDDYQIEFDRTYHHMPVECGPECRVTIELTDGTVIDVEPYVWEVTRPILSGGQLHHEVIGTFTQLPFKLAWAMTIHKSQGQTLEHAIVDIKGGTFATGQLYVALSRCTSLEGLVLRRAVIPKDLKVDQVVRRYLSANSDEAAHDYVYMAVVNVGQGDGFVRPLEIAIAFPDGNVVSSIVDPTRDLGDAKERYGIGAADVQAAPTLADVWPEIVRHVEGKGIVAREGEHLAAVIDVELKRHGFVVPVDAFVDAPTDAFPQLPDEAAPDASRRALGLLKAVEGGVRAGHSHPRGVPYRQKEAVSGGSYEPSVYGFGVSADGVRGWTLDRDGRVHTDFEGAEHVARLLERKLQGHVVGAATRKTIADFCATYGVSVDVPEADELAPICEVLAPGVRIAFTGTAHYAGQVWDRESLGALAARHGFEPKGAVSKTRCDLLVAADVSSRSGKANNARKWGKPIYSVEEFLKAVGVDTAGCAR